MQTLLTTAIANNCADFQQLWCLRETRYQIAPRALAFVTSPCLIIQPDSSLIHSHNLAETLQSELVNANCEVHIVEGEDICSWLTAQLTLPHGIYTEAPGMLYHEGQTLG